jgi:polynucleotide 5'-triphosphatase
MPPNNHIPHNESSFEPSIDNNEPYNDMERQICDFLFQYIIVPEWRFTSPTKLEVEAKLGSIKDWNDPSSRMRFQPSILTDVVIDPNGHARPQFESSMKTEQHARLNKYLNHATQLSHAPGRRKIDYKHTRETDYFYEIPQHALHLVDPVVMEWHQRSGKRGAPRLRVTKDNATNTITAVIIKTRIQDIEIRCPFDEFDFRISISLETAWHHDNWQQFPEYLDKGVRTSRNKDRLSYRHQGFLVDLTQVTPFSAGGKVEKSHELEIECDADRLLEEGYKNRNGETNEYEKLVHVFLNNVKVVNRAAKAPPQMGPMR